MYFSRILNCRDCRYGAWFSYSASTLGAVSFSCANGLEAEIRPGHLVFPQIACPHHQLFKQDELARGKFNPRADNSHPRYGITNYKQVILKRDLTAAFFSGKDTLPRPKAGSIWGWKQARAMFCSFFPRSRKASRHASGGCLCQVTILELWAKQTSQLPAFRTSC